MNRMGKVAATVLGALLALGVCGVASAQGSAQQPADNTQQPGATQPGATQKGEKEAAQESFDREKVTLKDQVQNAISEADQNIDALKRMSKTDKGDLKKRDEDDQKRLTMLRGHLKGDLDKIDKASVNDWSGVRPVVERDLGVVNSQLDKVAAITKIPRVGAASKQPAEGQQPATPPSNTQTPQNK